jgi:hypothetical protein
MEVSKMKPEVQGTLCIDVALEYLSQCHIVLRRN